jgi:hypothetical protein
MAGVAEVPVETVDDDMDLVAGDAEETFDDGPLVDDGDGQLLIPGTGGGLSLKVTGKKPTTASIRLVGGKIDVTGQFDKQDRIALYVEAVVVDVQFPDTIDSKTGQVTSCERKHIARITGVRNAAGE